MTSLRLNLTDNEANSTAREFTVPPTGSYVANIVSVEDAVCGPSSKNPGKPYWKVRFVIDEGKYAGNNIFANLMLFEGAAFLIKQLVEVLFPDMLEGNTLSIPDAEAFETKTVTVVGRKWIAGSKRRDNSTRDREEFQVTGFRSAKSENKTTSDTSLLP